jgi:hypothetical protein
MAATEMAVVDRTMQLQRAPQEHNGLDPFEPTTWQGLLELAAMVSKTQFAPKDFVGKPEACAIAMMYGRQLGVGGLQAIQNIAVINGRPSVYGDLFWAIILAHPEFKDVEERTDGTNGAWVKLTRKGRTPKEATFTPKDAQIAQLWGKAGPWTNYPSAMMLWRARSIAGRALFADALKGMISSYEAEDYSDGPTIDGNLPNAELAKDLAPVVAKAAEVIKITQDEAREFGKAWKASGLLMQAAKAALKEICGVEASLDIPKDKYQEAMRWATKNDNWPDPVPTMGPDEKLCRELFAILSYDLAAQAAAIDESKGDWAGLAMKLNKELPVE